MDKQLIIFVLSCLGIIQALFLCFYLLTLKEKKANTFLALLILGLTIRIGKSIFNHYFELEPWQRNLGLSGLLMVGPFLLLYRKALLDKQKEFTWHDYRHLLPVVLFAVFSWIIPNKGDLTSFFIYLAILVHGFVYIVLNGLYISRHNDQLPPQLLEWFRNILIGIAFIWLLYAGILFRVISPYILGAVSYSFLVYVFSYLLLKRHVFALEKYSYSASTPAQSARIVKQLKDLFARDKLYLDPDLNLNSLAQRLSITPRELSQAINELEQKNFAEFINTYRLEKAVALLTDPKYARQKIAAVAYESGFGNVTSFNLAFKSKMQMTPSEYRENFRSLSKEA